MSKVILRTAKLKSIGNVLGSLAHAYRTIQTDNADSSRTHLNSASVSSEEAKERFKSLLPPKPRKNAVLAIEYLIGASPEWQGWHTKKQDEYFKRALQFLENKHGKENIITSVVHMDETTPHMSVFVVPIDKKGKLNCRDFLGGREKLRNLQTDFAKKVESLGLERGVEGSKAEHNSIKKYYSTVNQSENNKKLLEKVTEERDFFLSLHIENLENLIEVAKERGIEKEEYIKNIKDLYCLGSGMNESKTRFIIYRNEKGEEIDSVEQKRRMLDEVSVLAADKENAELVLQMLTLNDKEEVLYTEEFLKNPNYKTIQEMRLLEIKNTREAERLGRTIKETMEIREEDENIEKEYQKHLEQEQEEKPKPTPKSNPSPAPN